jgi:hypothetical protein
VGGSIKFLSTWETTFDLYNKEKKLRYDGKANELRCALFNYKCWGLKIKMAGECQKIYLCGTQKASHTSFFCFLFFWPATLFELDFEQFRTVVQDSFKGNPGVKTQRLIPKD